MYGTQCGVAGGEAREKRMVWKKKEAYWKRHRLELHDAFGTISTSTKTNEQPSSQPNSPLAANKHAGWQPTKPASSKKDPILLEFLLERWRRRREWRASHWRRRPALTVLPGFSLILDLLSYIDA